MTSNPASMFHAQDFLPTGISVQRDDFATSAEGKPCIRVMVRRDVDRLTHVFEVPIHKKTVTVRRGFLFPRYEEVVITDHERIADELRDEGYARVRELMA